jgi:hypothetical protein
MMKGWHLGLKSHTFSSPRKPGSTTPASTIIDPCLANPLRGRISPKHPGGR